MIKSLTQKQWFLPVSVGVAGFVSGVITREVWSRVKSKPEEPVAEVRDLQLVLDFDTVPKLPDREESKLVHPSNQPPDKWTPMSTVDVESIVKKIGEDAQAVVNVFVEDGIEWDWETELADREGKEVYILHQDEFFGDESPWDNQSAYTYYAGDDVLVDERESVVYNGRQHVGELRFGHGSKDPNVFYVRNEKLHAEYEVIRNPGSYSIEVLGLAYEEESEAELKHSRGLGKFRFE